MQVARRNIYDACYFGCADCSDPSFAYNACATSAGLNVAGVVCDGRVMWNWKDRYPAACLRVAGEVYRRESLRDVERKHRSRFALIILTVLGGVVGERVTYDVFW